MAIRERPALIVPLLVLLSAPALLRAEPADPLARAQYRLANDVNLASWSDTRRRVQTVYATTNCAPDGARMMVLDLFPVADAFHFTSNAAAFQGALQATYQVLTSRDAVLRNAGGSSFWWYDNTSAGQSSAFYSSELWDLRTAGATNYVRAPVFRWNGYAGALLAKGVHRLDSHRWFQIYSPNLSQYLGYVPNITTLANSDARHGQVRFTVANLNSYTVTVDSVVGNWSPTNGYVGAELWLTDADGARFELPGAVATATLVGSGGASTSVTLRARGVILRTQPVQYRYRFVGDYADAGFDATQCVVSASAWVLKPDGTMQAETATSTVARSGATPLARDVWLGTERRSDARTDGGTLRETRSIWMHSDFLKWWQSADKLQQTLAGTERMNANILVAMLYHSGMAYVPSTRVGQAPGFPTGYDGFAGLLAGAYARGMEVHAEFSCMNAGNGLPQCALSQHPEWGVVDLSTNRSLTVADVHRPEYRAFLCAHIADVVRRYPVDGVKLDYIRAIRQCICEPCRQEYAVRTGGRDLNTDARTPRYTEAYMAWQDNGVSALVSEIRAAIDAVRPGVKLSTWGGYEKGEPGYQGRRPDLWLNNGWIDFFELDNYGNDPESALTDWAVHAMQVTRPDCVWPTLGLYELSANSNAVALGGVTLTGDWHSSAVWGRRPKALVPIYTAFRDRAKLNGFGFFDLADTNTNMLQGLRDLFLTEPAVPWYDPSTMLRGRVDWYGEWTRRQPITLQASQLSGTTPLSDFAALVQLTDESNPVFTQAQADGDDLVFTAADGTTKLSHEIEQFETAAGGRKLVAWIRIPLLPATVDTTIYLYYGRPKAGNQQDVGGVWPDYVAVYHLSETNTTAGANNDVRDSGPGANHGDAFNGVVLGVATGKVGRAARFSQERRDYVQMANPAKFNVTNVTLSLWFRTAGNRGTSYSAGLAGKRSAPEQNLDYDLKIRKGGFRWYTRHLTGYNVVLDQTAPGGAADGAWHHYAAVADHAATTLRVYVNGNLDKSMTYTPATIGWSDIRMFAIGQTWGSAATDHFDGLIDEVRVDRVVRSADWIKAEYTQQLAPQNYTAFGMEQRRPDGSLLLIR
jgi:uncharacterized lipoprotein YddW (UPF0748 family)